MLSVIVLEKKLWHAEIRKVEQRSGVKEVKQKSWSRVLHFNMYMGANKHFLVENCLHRYGYFLFS